MVRFEGTITTAAGTLEVTGRLMSIDLMPTMPGMPPIPMASLDALKLIVTGGTGDTADQVGLIFGIDTDGNLPLPPSFEEGYHGALCPMPDMPAPPAPPAP